MPNLMKPSPAPPTVVDRLQLPKVSFSVPETSETTSLAKSFLYTAMRDAKLKFIKAGPRRLILASDLEAFLSSLSQGPETA